jgi:hypothetical protein
MSILFPSSGEKMGMHLHQKMHTAQKHSNSLCKWSSQNLRIILESMRGLTEGKTNGLSLL